MSKQKYQPSLWVEDRKGRTWYKCIHMIYMMVVTIAPPGRFEGFGGSPAFAKYGITDHQQQR